MYRPVTGCACAASGKAASGKAAIAAASRTFRDSMFHLQTVDPKLGQAIQSVTGLLLRHATQGHNHDSDRNSPQALSMRDAAVCKYPLRQDEPRVIAEAILCNMCDIFITLRIRHRRPSRQQHCRQHRRKTDRDALWRPDCRSGQVATDQRMMISTRRFCGSRTPGPVGTSRWVSPKPWMAIAPFGTPSLTSSAATAWARRIDRPWLYCGVPEVSV